MTPGWEVLSKRVKKGEDWFRIWGAIAYAKAKSNRSKRRKTRSDERDEFSKLAKAFGELAANIEGGILDVQCYDLLSKETWGALGAPDFHAQDQWKRLDTAHKFLEDWPSPSEILRGLESRARALADEAMKRPRAYARARYNVGLRIFVCELGADFRQRFGTPLHGTIALIATVTFGEEVTRAGVQNMLKTYS